MFKQGKKYPPETKSNRPPTSAVEQIKSLLTDALNIVDKYKLSEKHTTIAEEVLRQSEERFKIAAICANDLIYEWNIKNDNLEWYGNVDKALGYSRGELPRTFEAWAKKISPADCERVAKAIKKHLKGRSRIFREEYRIKRKDGTYCSWIDQGMVIRDKMGEPYKWIGACTDITEYKKLEKKKETFISLASHELKTPITTVKAFGQLLKERIQKFKDKKTTHYLKRMNQQLDRLVKIIDQLLEVSRIKAGKLKLHKEFFSIDKLLRDTIDDIQAISKTHKIIKKGGVKALVFADKCGIALVLSNLLTNAIQYSPQSDRVIVKITVNNHCVTVSVRDFGAGVPKSEQEKIFNSFYTINCVRHEISSGLGLGLFIAKSIIGLHRGKIWVKSKIGKGSTFYFSLPVRKKKQEVLT